ncbi:response regulator transcription factor [Christensenellaceae bacterium OttesenSCG-928-M15]|nr:response regulator transcription factor [Christensenellaceae bacterium OttesenSCG-928-M15]
MLNILVVEDDRSMRRLMEAVLLQEGYQVLVAQNGQEALDLLEKQHVDLMITDIMMPQMDGYALTRELRGAGFEFPILMVTAKEEKQDKRKGFLAGTDDYMTKPIDEEEMLLRVKALLRRAKIQSDRKLHIGKVTLLYDALTVIRETEQITLPQKEFLLLYKLLSYPDMIFTRMQLMDEIWGMDTKTDEHTVSVHISRLRERFFTWPEFEIITVRGLGYKAVRHDEA